MTRKVPSYIEKAEVVGVPLDCRWEGALDHIGPVETVNKMFNLVASKTTCGVLTEAAGIIGWGAWRLKGLTDVDVLLQLVEATFAFQVHPYYVDRNGVVTRKAKDEPAGESAAGELQVLLWKGLNAEKWWDSYYQPIDTAYHSAYLVKHIIPKPKQKLFTKWLEGMFARIQQFAPKPEEQPVEDESSLTDDERAAYYARHWGEALPPEILDPDFDYNPARRAELVDKFLRSVDWRTNPFLRAPDAMLAMGFVSKPYQLS
jgi:hypothetical protein